MNKPKQKFDPEVQQLAKEMFVHCCEQFAAAFVSCSKQPFLKPNHLTNAMYGTFGSIVHKLEDKKWQEMMDVKPCGASNCDCHVLLKEFMVVMDKVRTKAKRMIDEQKGEQAHEM